MEKFIYIIIIVSGAAFVIYNLRPYISSLITYVTCWFLLRQVRRSVKDKEAKAKLKELEKMTVNFIKQEKI